MLESFHERNRAVQQQSRTAFREFQAREIPKEPNGSVANWAPKGSDYGLLEGEGVPLHLKQAQFKSEIFSLTANVRRRHKKATTICACLR